MLRTFLLALACAFGAVAQPAAPLYSNCAQTEQIGVLPASAEVKVSSSIASSEGTCYKVEGTSLGQPVRGAIFDGSHPAVAAYRRTLTEPPTPLPSPVPAPVTPSAQPARFENITGTNFHDGERFELARLRARLIIIHFWDSATDTGAQHDAEYLSHLRAQYGDRGLEVVGITNESSFDRVRTFNENTEAVWPLLRDRTGLAARYGIEAPSQIIVLDSRRNILSRDARPGDLEAVLERRLAVH